MEAKQPSKLKSALNYGAMLGLLLMIISLLIFVFELYESSKWLNWISMIILAAGLYMGVKNYRDQVAGGFISYGGAVGYGTLVALFAGIITSIFSYIYLGYIDDGFVQFQLTQTEDELYAQGLPDEQIEMTLEWTKKFMAPGILAVSGIIMNTIFGLIISLIVAAILKKDPENFEDVA